jgi:DNA mismatch repair protein MutS
VTELITPGLAIIDEVLSPKTNNFLAAISLGKQIGISFLDVSTGEFLVSQGTKEEVDKLLQNFNPSEILVSKQKKESFSSQFSYPYQLFYLEDWVFQHDFSIESLCTHFKTKNLKGFGIENLNDGVIAAGAIMHYLSETQHQKINHITSLKRIPKEDYVWMDRFTTRNLELFYSNNLNAVTLIDVIDKTISPMGGRLLKRWLALPLKDINEISKRHEVVKFLMEDLNSLNQIQHHVKLIGDIERLISKVATFKISPREVIHLKNSLEAIIPIKSIAEKSINTSVKEIGLNLSNCDELRKRIKETLLENSPVNILKGNSISSDYSDELKELRRIAFSGKEVLDKMLTRESEATGITSLKIASNNVFGYYIEVRNTHKDKVPEHWIRKQTLVNAERYITEELKEYESKILGAEEKIMALEIEIFNNLVQWLGKFIKEVQNNSFLIAKLDCLSGFSQLAIENNYCMPLIDDSYELDIKEGRHPVIEKQLKAHESYISNDVFLDSDKQQIIMITGPNMSGKSAILRQTAIIVLMAQMGSFVPAKSVRMGWFDKIFTRVGASDNISMGESTFMVEMNETASILNNISGRSLILLDEIGRGTSTYDGISIAWAISEFLHDNISKPKTLFATHYHELNEMTSSFKRIKNFNVSVKEEKNDVLFLRKLVPGGSEHSFGIHVAKMAGMPNQVLKKAHMILKKLEKSHSNEELTGKVKSIKEDHQLQFFNLDNPILEELKEEILNIDINSLTPVEALLKLSELKKKIDN